MDDGPSQPVRSQAVDADEHESSEDEHQSQARTPAAAKYVQKMNADVCINNASRTLRGSHLNDLAIGSGAKSERPRQTCPCYGA